MNETVTVVSQTQCETVYSVGGLEMRVWAIVGGTLAIGSNNYAHSQRFNYSEAHDGNKHNYLKWAPPTYKDLDGGIETLINYAYKVKADLALREYRVKQVHNIIGDGTHKTFRDAETKDRRVMTFRLERHYCPPLTYAEYGYRCRNAHGFGPCHNYQVESDEKWFALHKITELIFSKRGNWENISNQDFSELLKALQAVV